MALRKTGKSYSIFRRKILTKRANRISGLAEAVDKLNDLGDVMDYSEEILEVLDDAATIPRDYARGIAPYQTLRKHPAGWKHIREAIFSSRGDQSKDKRGPTVLVGVNARKAPQAFWLEVGTIHISPRPFWRPSLARTRVAVARVIENGVTSLVERIVAGR